MRFIEIPKYIDSKPVSRDYALANEYYHIWTEDDIKHGFNNGHGTIKDFMRYAENNKQFAHFEKI